MKGPQSITIQELADITLSPGRYTRIMPGKQLKYAAPGVDGLGLSFLSLMVPESVVLFVAPAGCARHVCMRAYEHGVQDRLFLLRVEEHEIVSGAHLLKIPAAVEEILAKAHPKAMYISSSCIDTMLASDYESLCRELSAKFHIRISPSYMDPIMFDSKKSPDNRIHCSICGFVQKQGSRDKGINIIGASAPIVSESELYEVLSAQGHAPIRHMAMYKTLTEADAMGKSSLSIVTAGNGKMAAEEMQRKHGIPYILFPIQYSPQSVRASYARLGEKLGVSIEDDVWHEQAVHSLQTLEACLSGRTIAIGKSIKGNPFEMAETLSTYGCDIRVIIKNKVTPEDVAVARRLAKIRPDITVYSGDHPTLVNLRQTHEKIDIAIGADAAYFYWDARPILFPKLYEPFGYQAMTHLAEQLRSAAKGTFGYEQ